MFAGIDARNAHDEGLDLARQSQNAESPDIPALKNLRVREKLSPRLQPRAELRAYLSSSGTRWLTPQRNS
jgi:hypothetical protein